MQRLERLCKDIPVGYDYNEVLEKGMRVYKAARFFTMSPYYTSDGKVIWTAEVKTNPPFSRQEGMVLYKYIEDLDEWIEIDKQ